MKSISVYKGMNKISLVIMVITFFVIVILSMMGYARFNLSKYFDNETIYQTITVEYDSFLVEDGYIIFDANSTINDFGGHFIISGNNYIIIKQNGLLDKIADSDEITIVSALGYFGDGWDYPIVQIQYDDITYLKFEEGKNNIVEEYKVQEEIQRRFYIISLPILALSILVFLSSSLILIKFRRIKIFH